MSQEPRDAVTDGTLLKIASWVIGTLVTAFGVLFMFILLGIQTDIKEVKRTVDGICDTQAEYWPDHRCKR